MHCLHLPVSIRTTNKSISGIYIERLADAQKNQDAVSQVGLIGIRPVDFRTLCGILLRGGSIPRTRVEYNPSITQVDWNLFGYDKRRGKGALIYTNKMLDLFEKYKSSYGTPDIIHAHSGRGAGLAALLIKCIYGIPYVVTEHNPAYIRGGLESERSQLEVVYEGAERIYTVSEGMFESAKKFTDKQLRIFPNVIDDIFVEEQVRDPDVDFYFLSVGRFDDNKNQELAIESIKKFNNEFDQKIKLKLVGEGSKLADKKEFAEQINAEEWIEFLGFVDENRLSRLYSKAIATLVCSKHEPFGLPIIESVATGTPVIATSTAGSESISSSINKGLYITEPDADAFMKKMFETFKMKKHERDEIAKMVISKYSKEAVAKLSVEEYSSIIYKSESTD